ncbi:hypothetical protein [Nocardioides sp. YIM 152315]|uniref:hypothetical protein n=1 Tax=Nocardioides sp. YIM 152315 TaxID=3031760 RepID=UPI0023DA46C1|nr:hypothetical protein [Nocardioides sp. YIM 152315]MDF1605807.1 hypothetical protein [Nocardioides sp. YIM 152315]
METSGERFRIGPGEAAASLAAAKESRRMAQRADYPVWFWLGCGAALALVPLWIGEPWMGDAWEQVLPLVSLWLALATGWAAYRIRRVRESISSPGTRWQLLAVLAPAAVVMLAGGIAWHYDRWQAPAAPLGTAAAVFVVVVGVGLCITDRPSRR